MTITITISRKYQSLAEIPLHNTIHNAIYAAYKQYSGNVPLSKLAEKQQ